MNIQQARQAARRAEVIRLYREVTTDVDAIAQQMGTTSRTVLRDLEGVRPRRREVRARIRERLREAMADGMPSTWAAEEVGVSVTTAVHVAQSLPNRRENVREWQSAWAAIRNNPRMYELHREIAPKA